MSELKGALLGGRGVIRVSGPEARSFLQGLITNNIDLVAPGRAIYAGLLTPQGKFLFDFLIAEDSNGDLLLDCDGARAPDLQKRLTFYKLRAKVSLENVSASYSVLAFWDGEVSAELEGVTFTDPRLAALGSRLITTDASDALQRASAQQFSEADYHRHRIALGVGDAASDFEPDRSFPLEVNFDELNGVDFKKGCFIGQEVTSRTKRRGSVRKRLLPCIVEGPMPQQGAPVHAGTREAGTVHSIDTEGHRVLALLRLDLLRNATLKAEGATLVAVKPEWASFDIENIPEEAGNG